MDANARIDGVTVLVEQSLSVHDQKRAAPALVPGLKTREICVRHHCQIAAVSMMLESVGNRLLVRGGLLGPSNGKLDDWEDWLRQHSECVLCPGWPSSCVRPEIS
jgi:hypothetical protein